MSVYDKVEKIGQQRAPIAITAEAQSSILDILGGNLPPAAVRPNMAAANEMPDDDILEVEERAKSRLTGGGGSAAQPKAAAADLDDEGDNGDGYQEPSSNTGPEVGMGDAMGDLFSEHVGDVAETVLQMSTELGYEATYIKKIKNLQNARASLANNITAMQPEQVVEAKTLITAIDDRMKYYNKRLSEIGDKILIKERDKTKMATLVSQMMQVSQVKVSPFMALVGILVMYILKSVFYIGSDFRKYNAEHVLG
jgi:hypothetical protein